LLEVVIPYVVRKIADVEFVAHEKDAFPVLYRDVELLPVVNDFKKALLPDTDWRI
jgi:hypothetical protein